MWTESSTDGGRGERSLGVLVHSSCSPVVFKTGLVLIILGNSERKPLVFLWTEAVERGRCLFCYHRIQKSSQGFALGGS